MGQRNTRPVARGQAGAMSRRMSVLRSLAAALALAPALASAEGAPMPDWRGIETPPATVIWSEETPDGILELRDYGPHVVAEVTVRGGRTGAASTGFRRLAGYIFGGNEGAGGGSEKIAMTSPVGQTPEGDGTWTIAFTMPSRWSMDTLPAPKDEAVRLRRDPGGRRLSLGFTGRWTQDGLETRAEALRGHAARRGLTPAGTASYLFYDGPMTPAFMRRNEVSIPVR